MKDTAEALNNYDKSNDVYELHTKLLKATEENLKISQLLHENGIVNYIDLLDAQRNNANTQLDLSSATNHLQNARVPMYKPRWWLGCQCLYSTNG